VSSPPSGELVTNLTDNRAAIAVLAAVWLVQRALLSA